MSAIAEDGLVGHAKPEEGIVNQQRTLPLALVVMGAIALVSLRGAVAAPPHVTCLGKRATLVGTDGPDVLTGTERRDVIAGLGGDDVLRGLDGRDTVCGGAGADTLDGGPGVDQLDGGTGDDAASYAASADPVVADLVRGDGSDSLTSVEGLIGSPGGDTLTGDGGPNTLEGGAGDDVLDGGPGSDTTVYAAAPTAIVADLGAGTASGDGGDTLVAIENVIGSSHGDDLFGDDGPNRLLGGAGADLLQSEAGADELAGDAGDDILRGGSGTDTLTGGAGVGDECVDGEVLAGCERTGTGTFRIDSFSSFDYLDPALSYFSVTWQYLSLVCATLVSYPDAAAPSGSYLVPDAAVALPTVSPDGRTYTFEIRSGLRFAPPSGALVTAAAFKASIERTLAPVMHSPATAFLDDVVGFDAYRSGAASHISGIVANGQTLTLTIAEARGDLLARLAMPFFCVLPIGTPTTPGGVTTPVPSAGPYYTTSYAPAIGATVERNPYYRGRRASTFDRLEWKFGSSLSQQELDVTSGISDHGGFPASSAAALAALYGPGSPAAGAGRQRFFVEPASVTWYLALNTERPLFANENLRKAVAYAIDRTAMTALHGDFAGTPTDQILPRSMPGYADRDLYPLTPNAALASQYAALAGVTPTSRVNAVMYTFNVSRGPGLAAHVQAVLAPLGIDVEIKQFDRVVQHVKSATRGEPFDITVEGWGMDYLDPANFLDTLLNGANIRPTNNVNVSYFDDPVFNARLDAASALGGADRYQAYADLDRDLSTTAPIVPYVNTNARLFFSDRIGCHTFAPWLGGAAALNVLCVRPD